ncbi:hypothetical protein Trydic_g4450 [Trypoxylus dichotomus]
MQQVCGSDCWRRTNAFLWRKRFLGGRERLEDDNREKRPISARTPEMIQEYVVLLNNRNASQKIMEEDLSISRETI